MSGDTSSGRDLTARSSAQLLVQAHNAVSEGIVWLDLAVSGDPQRAVLADEIDQGNRLPEIHGYLLLYYRQLKPHLITRAKPRYNGDYYDDGITTVKIPYGPASAAESRTKTETLDGLQAVEDWSMRSQQRPGEQSETRVYLSPEAIVEVYTELSDVQTMLGLNVSPSKEQDSSLISREPGDNRV